LDKTIDASLNETPDQTKKILKTKHAQAIGRVVYFCNEVIQDPISKDHNSIHHVNGWIDYDVGFAPPAHHEIPISQMQIEEKEELLLCSPDQYLAPNPQLLEEGMP
jgi:hypothetical protein